MTNKIALRQLKILEKIDKIEKLKKEESFKTNFVKDLEQENKEANQILNNYYGED